jgi:hypothetical protein
MGKGQICGKGKGMKRKALKREMLKRQTALNGVKRSEPFHEYAICKRVYRLKSATHFRRNPQ